VVFGVPVFGPMFVSGNPRCASYRISEPMRKPMTKNND
jgi:hypothetical protein